MELPTYTSIWRIEKRLYKLYDFRLPMPVPVGQIVVFTATTVPYVILLTLLGLPFSHSLFWLYVLPPGVLTWLSTRPVLESKRLPELIMSQVRYLGEPSRWHRLAPATEKDVIVVTGKVWRRAGVAGRQPGEEGRPAETVPDVAVPGVPVPAAGVPDAGVPDVGVRGAGVPDVGVRAGGVPDVGVRAGGVPGAGVPGAGVPAMAGADTVRAAGQPGGVPARQRGLAAVAALPGRQRRPAPGAGGTGRAQHEPGGPAAPERREWALTPPAPASGTPPGARSPAPGAEPGAPPPVSGAPPCQASRTAPATPARTAPAQPLRTVPAAATAGPVPAQPAPKEDRGAGQGTGMPVVVIPPRRDPQQPPPARSVPVVERALSGPAAGRRGPGWREHVVVVPGGRGPGRPDFEKRDRARAVLPLPGPQVVTVLGCTVGAGQTVIALMLADLLASLRGEPVAALDLNPGPASLAGLAGIPAIDAGTLLAPGPGRAPESPRGWRGRGRLDVIAYQEAGGEPGAAGAGYGAVLACLASRYRLTFADPGAPTVSRVLAASSALLLVAPASPDAGRAVAMTQEWLGTHGHGALTSRCVVVLNGVSKRTLPHAEQAARVARGRCRAIVRVPWDDHLGEPAPERGIWASRAVAGPSPRLGALRPPVLQAYTALAGVLVAGLASGQPQQRALP